jgi:hypothetical protein
MTEWGYIDVLISSTKQAMPPCNALFTSFLMHMLKSTAPRRTHRIYVVAALLIGAALFYWYEIRPIRVYRRCSVEASMDARALLQSKAAIATGDNAAEYQSLIDRNMYLRSDYQSFLSKCLLYYGLPVPTTVETASGSQS